MTLGVWKPAEGRSLENWLGKGPVIESVQVLNASSDVPLSALPVLPRVELKLNGLHHHEMSPKGIK